MYFEDYLLDSIQCLLYALNIFITVHGFSSVEYHVNESLALVDEFSLFVKGGSLGVSPTLYYGLPGSISSEAVTAKGEL